MLKQIIFSLLVAVSCSLVKGQVSADFYVSPEGNDAFSGVLSRANEAGTDGPFRSLQRARDAVRAATKHHTGDIVVMLRGGRYVLTETIVFDLRDSGKSGQRITYCNYPGEEPILTSAREINGWRKLAEDSPGLPTVSRGKVWVAELAPGVKPFAALYQGGRRLARAASPGFSALKDWQKNPEVSTSRLYYPADAGIRAWNNLSDVEAVLRPTFEFAMCILPFQSVDEAAQVATLAVPSRWPIAALWTQTPGDTNNVWIENVIDFLDQPGEWVLNTRENQVYFWPPDEQAPHDMRAPQLTELLRVEGRVDYAGPQDEPVRNLVFSGLSFVQADRLRWTEDLDGWDLQERWELFDRPTAMVRFRGAENCVIENCQFLDSASAGLRLDLHNQGNCIRNNVFRRLGGVGVLLAGYGPGVKDVNRGNLINNNLFSRIGQICWGSPAVMIWQSGENRVTHNLITEVPYSGIVISSWVDWRKVGPGMSYRSIRWAEVERTIDAGDPELNKFNYASWAKKKPYIHSSRNLVENNEISRFTQTLGDGNAIYVAGAGPENLLRMNFVHDAMSPTVREAIRCDDGQFETIIQKNVIYRTGGTAVGIAIKGQNTIVNNLIIDLVTGNSSFAESQATYLSLQVEPADGAIIQHNVILSLDKHQHPTGSLPAWYNLMPPPKWEKTRADYNLYFNVQDSKWADQHLATTRLLGVELHSLVANPMLRDPARRDFRFRPGSPALSLGIEQIDISSAGLTAEFPRKFLD